MKNERLIERIDTVQKNLTTLLDAAGKLPARQKAVLDETFRGLLAIRNDIELDESSAVRVSPQREPVTVPLYPGQDEYKRLRASGTDYVYTVEIKDGHTVGTTHGPGCVAVTGYTAAEYVADPYLWLRMVHRDDRKAVLEQATRVRSGKEAYPLEHRIIHKSGSICWVRNAPVPRYDKQGRLVGYDGLITDITERKKSESVLRESEEKYRALFEASRDAIFLETLEGRIIDCNTSACNMYGYTKQELLKFNVSDLVPDEVARILPDLFKKQLESDSVTLEALNKRKNGDVFPCDVSTRLTTVGGERRVIAYIRDITEHKLAEQTRLRQLEAETRATVAETAKLALEKEVAERNQAEVALRESEARLRALIDNLPFEFWAVDGSLRYIMQNTTSIKNFGDVVGKRVEELDMPGAIIAQWVKQDQLALHGETLHQEYERIAGGEKRAYENLVAPVVVGEVIVGIVGVGMDVTERKRAEDVLEQRARQLTLINDISGRIAAVLDLDSLLNKAAHLIQESFDYHHVALFSLDNENNELIMKAKSGSFAHLYPINHRLMLDQGIVGWVATHGEKLLANDVRTEPKYVNLYPEVISTLSELSVPIRVGDELVGVLDVQSPLLNAFDDDDVLVMETLADQIAVAIENARLYKAMERELAERRQAEQALLESQHFTQRVIDATPVPIFYKDIQGNYLGCNTAFQEFLGWDKLEIIGKSVYALSPKDLADVYHEADTALFRQPGVQVYEAFTQSRDGSRRTVVFNKATFENADGTLGGLVGTIYDITERKKAEAALQESEKRYRTLVDTSPDAIFYINPEKDVILSNQRAAELYGVDNPGQMIGMSALNLFAPESHSWLIEEIAKFPRGWSVRGQEFILTKKDGTRFPAEVGASLVVDEKGEPLGVICVVRDITQRKLLEQYLVRTERLTAMGKISAELAHEIKNPLQSIQSNVELVLDFALDPNERQEHLSLCYRELQRLIELTNRLLNLANPNKMVYEAVSVSELVQRTLVLIDKSSKNVGVQVKSYVPSDLPLIRVAPDQVVEVLLNLSINAIEAMPMGGQLDITAEVDAGWVKLAVINNGDLIPHEHLESIFEPFFTTKPGGTGLGLSISHQIIQDMGGSLIAENLHEPNRVRFTVTLPASDPGHELENAS
jgi:PAS domain S-box-containing protein